MATTQTTTNQDRDYKDEIKARPRKADISSIPWAFHTLPIGRLTPKADQNRTIKVWARYVAQQPDYTPSRDYRDRVIWRQLYEVAPLKDDLPVETVEDLELVDGKIRQIKRPVRCYIVHITEQSKDPTETDYYYWGPDKKDNPKLEPPVLSALNVSEEYPALARIAGIESPVFVRSPGVVRCPNGCKGSKMACSECPPVIEDIQQPTPMR